MMCCSLGAFVMATMPMWRTWMKSMIGYAPAMTTATFAVALWVFVAQHLEHYLERAQENDRSLLAEILAQPICTGASAGQAVAAVNDPMLAESR